MSDLRNFLFYSKYPTDKIILLKTTSFSVPGSSGGYKVTVPHGLPFAPLVNGNWSLTPDFSVQYDYSSGPYPSGVTYTLFGRIVTISADATNIYFNTDNIGTTATFYCRVFGIAPADNTDEVPKTTQDSSNLIFSTENNMPKLFDEGVMDLPATSTSSNTIPIYHNLGYFPQVSGWVRYDTSTNAGVVPAIHPVDTRNGATKGIRLQVSDEAIEWYIPPNVSAHRAYYRIYGDD